MAAERILIVEDERFIAKDVEKTLKNLGYNIAGIADNGQEAVRLAGSKKPDLVLMDIYIKGMDGVESAKKIWNKFRIPVVYLTAYGDNNTLKKVISSKAFGFILKPFDEQTLKSHLELALFKYKTENELRKDDEMYQKIFKMMPDIVVKLNREGIITDINESSYNILGYKPEEIINKSISQSRFIPKASMNLILENFKKRMKGADIPPYEVVLKNKNNKDVIVFLSASVIRNEKGEIESELIVLKDITLHKKAEEILQKSENDFRQLFDTSPVGMALVDFTGKILMVNNVVTSFSGYSEHEIVNKRFIELKFFNKKSLFNMLKSFPRLLGLKGISNANESEIVTKNNERKVLKIIVSVVSYGGSKKLLVSFNDITDYKIINEALSDSQEKFESLFEGVKQPIIYVNLKGEIVKANPASFELIDVSPQEVIGKSFVRVLPLLKVNIKDMMRIFNDLVRGKDIGEREWEITDKNGEKRILLIKSSFIKKNNNLTGFAFILSDITERIKAERLLKESQTMFESLFENAPDIYYLTDLKGVILNANVSAEKIIGYKKNELIGKSFFSILKTQEVPRAAKSLAKAVLGNLTGPEIYTIETKRGKYLDLEIVTKSLKVGEKSLVLGTARDLTERRSAEKKIKESEANYKMLFDNVSDVVAQIDNKGNIITINEKVYDMLGFKSEELIGRNILMLKSIIATDLHNLFKRFKKTVSSGRTSVVEIMLKHKSGKGIIIELSSQIIRDEGRITGITALMRDITERKKTEKLQKNYEKELKRQVRERTKQLTLQNAEVVKKSEQLKDSKAKLEKRTKELELLKDSLEKKVNDRTIELQKKMSLLERFTKIAVDRELKMIELKKQLKKR